MHWENNTLLTEYNGIWILKQFDILYYPLSQQTYDNLIK